MSKNRYNLTDRELEVARWILIGYTSKEVGRILNITPRTVEQHVNNVRMRLGARNRSNMAAHLILKGIVTLTVKDIEDWEDFG